MNSGIELVALHGFLGLASDWLKIPGLNTRALDLWPHALAGTSWAEGLYGKPVLLGYSMGGRLAMRAAVEEPERWSGAIFVSAHPGLASGHAERLQSDLAWAARFRRDPWPDLMQDWNSQAVLSVGGVLERHEHDFDRKALALAIDRWSLARQPDLREGLSRLPFPVLFVTGARDEKFTKLARELRRSELQTHVEVEGAGHRVPWDRPYEFQHLVAGWLAGKVRRYFL
jgi:2-succinyl-6-hydroxy-2,4-cyclohexadiene-1-carboxylate synthase